MQNDPMRWDDLRVFLEVARQGRLLAAGRRLGIDPATAGRRIAALEAALEARLFERSPQGYALTEAGRFSAGLVRDLVGTVGGGIMQIPGKVLNGIGDRLSALFGRRTATSGGDTAGEPAAG